MAEVFSEMFAVSFNLHEDYTFEGTMAMMPVEGNWEQKGDRLFLTPTKVMGKTEKEFKKMAEKMAESFESGGGMEMKMTSDGFDTLELRIVENGNALIAINALDSDSQELVFRRKQ